MDNSIDHTAMESAWLPPDDALAYFEPPEGIQLAAVNQVQQRETVRYGFRIGDLGLLIDTGVGSEVLAMPDVATLPNTPPGFMGLINLRGNLVPVYDLRIMLDLSPRAPGVEAMVLVFGKGDRAVGVSIDGYPEALIELHRMPHLPAFSEVIRKHFSTGYIKDDSVWLEFDHNNFFETLSGATASDSQNSTENFDS